MSIKSYGVLKGKAIDSKNGMGQNPHFQVLISDGELLHRIAVNVKSKMAPSELLYLVDDDFQHPMTDSLLEMPQGYNSLDSKPGDLALDFIRGNHFDTSKMKPLSHDIVGPDNDLNELIHKYISRAIGVENSIVYAFGAKWGPESERDKYFGFKPGNGIHDIHMNQGNSPRWKKDDGVWQDGAMLIHFPEEDRWVGIFLAFQSQCFHTDDVTGHSIDNLCQGSTPTPIPEPSKSKSISIVAAMVNSKGKEAGNESVTLINLTPNEIALDGWMLADKHKRKEILNDSIQAGKTRKIDLSGESALLANSGGIITLLDQNGTKIDGVSYTKKEAGKEDWTILFTK
jgi:uncharacterized protein YukJ